MAKRDRERDRNETISLVEPESAVADPPADEEEADGLIHIKLSKPIQVFADQVSELKLRKPTGADLIRVGNPVIFDPISVPPRIEHDFPKMIKIIARLANVPVISLDMLTTHDLVVIAWSLTPYFLPRPGSV